MSDDPRITELLRAWASHLDGNPNWEPLSDRNFVYRVTAPGGAYILKVAGQLNPQGIDPAHKLVSEYDLMDYLKASGIPVAVPLLTDAGQPFLQCEDGFYTLTPALPHAPSLDDNPRRVFCNIGAAIARLHRALAAYTGPIFSWTMNLPPRILDEAVPLILSHQPAWQNEKLLPVIDALRAPLGDYLTGLPAQYIHGDCHSGNLLRVGEEVSGFIDMDHLPFGPRVYDPTYHLTGEIVGKFHDPAVLERWLDILVPSLFAGYEQETVLTTAEKDAVPYMMMGICLIMAGWLYEHNILPDVARDNVDLFFWLYDNGNQVRSAVS